MDNLTHTLSGFLLRRTGLGRDTPWATPVLAVAANLPDFEGLVVNWLGRPGYLIHHRGITHSLFGAIPQALLFAGAVWLLGLWAARRWPDRLPRPPGFRSLFVMTLSGVIVHLALDWINTYGIRLLLPFDERWFYGDVAFIIDPWMWILMGAGSVLTVRLTRATAIAWFGVAALAGAVTLTAAVQGVVSGFVAIVWFLLLAGIVAAAFLRRRSASAPVLAGAFAAVLVLYGGGLFLLGRAARDVALEFHRDTASQFPAGIVSVNARPGIPWEFQVTVWHPRGVYRYGVSALESHPRSLPPIDPGLDDPALDAIQSTPEYRAWKVFARQPVVRRRGRYLILGDARYRLEERGDWSEMIVELPAGN